MRWTPRKRDGRWQPWFAWHPVKVGDAWVWLETIQRRDEIQAIRRQTAAHIFTIREFGNTGSSKECSGAVTAKGTMA